MSRIKFEILGEESMLKELFGNVHEAFVNQYVYDDFEEAAAKLRQEWQTELEDIQGKQIALTAQLKSLEEKEQQIRFMILDYDKTHVNKDTGE